MQATMQKQTKSQLRARYAEVAVCGIWLSPSMLFCRLTSHIQKDKSWTRRYPAARAKTILAPKPSSLESGLHRPENVHSQVNFFAWLLHYWAEFKIFISILVISIYILVIYIYIYISL